MEFYFCICIFQLQGILGQKVLRQRVQQSFGFARDPRRRGGPSQPPPPPQTAPPPPLLIHPCCGLLRLCIQLYIDELSPANPLIPSIALASRT